MTSGSENFNEIITQVLTDNTAQSVLNHLSALESNRAHFRTRWVWELLQNARDASNGFDAELVASVEQIQDEIVFRHNGAGFKLEEIAHLIFHGSTKVEDDKALGRYGSGFLTTHLLSPEIGVSGQLIDGRSFRFRLKRELGSVSELSDSMHAAAEEFRDSLSTAPRTDFTTEFRYPLKDDAIEIVAEGLATLKQCAPFVVAFNQEFSSIKIASSNESLEFKVVARTPLEQPGLEQVIVAEMGNERTTTLQYLISRGERSSVAVPMESANGSQVCLPIGSIPRLFLGFPLVGTERFSFPAIINSFLFTPTDTRDGIFLWQATNLVNQANQAALEEACGLLIRMLAFSAHSGWENVYHWANIPDMQTQNWLHEGRFLECIQELLIEQIRKNPVILNESGEAIRPDESQLPIADDTEDVMSLWDLLVELSHDRDIWPRRDESNGWCDAVKSWAALTNCDVRSFGEVIDGRSLASFVDAESRDASADPRTHRVSLLEEKIKDEVSAISWLDRLIGFVRNTGLEELMHEYWIVPSQAGFLRTLPRLHRDAGISNKLKEVSDLLTWGIRRELMDVRLISLAGESGAGDWDDSYVIEELTKRLRERIDENLDDNCRKASLILFTWIVKQERWHALRGLPVFSRRTAPDRPIDIIFLPRNEQEENALFVPVKVWPQDLYPYADMFPPNHILSDDFCNELPNVEEWQSLIQQSIVRQSPIVYGSMSVNRFYPDYPLPEDSEHQTVEQVTVIDIWNRSGVMDRVRDSQERGSLLWRFLTEWLLVENPESLEITRAECDCGYSHRYYPAAWIESIREHYWIRLPNDRRDRPSAHALASLLRGDERWSPDSVKEGSTTSKLLDAIGVSPLALMQEVIAEDEESRAALDDVFIGMLVNAGGDTRRLNYARQYIEDLRDDEDLPIMLDERRERRRLIHENQRLGDIVETLVKQMLEAEGFNVQRTGVGSDFAIEYDEITRLQVAKSDRTWLVEVKATRDNRVRMTSTQAMTAVKEGEAFLLCVVAVEDSSSSLTLDSVQKNVWFVANMGPRLAQLCDDLDGFNEHRDEIVANGSADIQLEVESSAVRVRVANSVWEQEGFSLNELAHRLE